MWDNHKAITLLQERQSVVLKYISEDVANTAVRDLATARSLADIYHAVEELKIEIVRHMAATQAANEYVNGLKRRQ